MTRRRSAAIVIGAIAATSVGGFVAGSRIVSPAEIASRTASPEPSPILVPVEERELSTEVVTRGTGRFGSPQKLSVPSSALKPTPGIVGALPIAGAQLAEGDVVASASGRPLFLLAGARPMSRDLGPGSTGDDVSQLEEALTRLGFAPGPADGTYDDATAGAVSAWYTTNGYSPFAATTEQLAAVRAREADQATATFDVTAATDAATLASASLSNAQVAATASAQRVDATARALDRANREAAIADVAANRDVDAKQATLDRLRSGQPAAASTPQQISVANADLVAARSNQVAVRTSGQRSVADAQSDLDRSPARLDAARAAATAADQLAAADVAAKQATLDELVADPSATPAQIAVAQRDVTNATTNAAVVHAEGTRTVGDAQRALDAAPAALQQARIQVAAANDLATADVAAKELAVANLVSPPLPTAADIASAEHDLAVAVDTRDMTALARQRSIDEATVASATANSDAGLATAAVTAAEGTLSNAQVALDTRQKLLARATLEADLVRQRAGVQVPADEVVFVTSVPVRVAEVRVVIGDLFAGALMSVTDSTVHVDTGLALSDASLVHEGMPVHLDEAELGIATDGVVALVAAAPGTNGVDGFHVYASIDVTTPPANLAGASVRLTIPITSSGNAVLAVPISALSLAADGSSRVQRSTGGVTEFVTVTPGLAASGYVAITAVGDALHAGDLVVIGVDQPAAATDPATTPDSTPADIVTTTTVPNGAVGA